MEDPKDIADAFADTAKKVVNQSRDEAVKAFNDINSASKKPTYTAGDALKTMAALAKIAVSGTIEMGQTALEVRPTQGVLILADHIATVLARTVKEAADVGSEASELIDKDKYTKNEWVQSAIKLSNIALLRGSEIFQTVAAGPAQYGDPIAKEKITLANNQVDNDQRPAAETGESEAGWRPECQEGARLSSQFRTDRRCAEEGPEAVHPGRERRRPAERGVRRQCQAGGRYPRRRVGFRSD